MGDTGHSGARPARFAAASVPELAAARPRARLMLVALAFVGLNVEPDRMPPVLRALHRWLDSWTGIGAIERGMYRQGYDLSLTRYASEGWRATFYSSGKEHSPTSTTGSAWERTPWRAVRVAAWEALTKLA